MKKLITIIILALTIGAQAQDVADKLYLKLVNDYRAKNGLAAVQYDATLDSASALHADWMFRANELTHVEIPKPGLPIYGVLDNSRLTRVDSTWTKRFDVQRVRENAVNYQVTGYYRPAFTVEQVIKEMFASWIYSPAHRAAILDPTVTHTGFGIRVEDLESAKETRGYACSLFAVKN
jgi:uncharacterized protein YkwD